jgi:hypothetical protein
MAWTEVTTGSKTTDGTEQDVVGTITTNGTYVFVIDTANMVNNDAIEIRIKTKVRSGDTSRVAYFATYMNVQGEPNKYSIAIPVSIELIVTLKRVNGSDRAYPWSLLRI